MQWAISTTEIKKFVDGTYTNNGWVIRTATETNDGYDFRSSDYPTDITQRPKLVIVYTVPSGQTSVRVMGRRGR